MSRLKFNRIASIPIAAPVRLLSTSFKLQTDEEFYSTMNGYRHDAEKKKICKPYKRANDTYLSDLPAHVDWREHGYVIGVGNQVNTLVPLYTSLTIGSFKLPSVTEK